MPTPTLEASYRRRWLVLAVLCLSVLLTVVSNMALNVALPTLGRQLHAGVSSLAWMVAIYVLCFAGLLLPAGAVGDRFGRKGTLQCGLAIFAVAASLGAFSGATWELIVARAVMGIGAALILPGTLSILATVFPPAERQKAIAIWAAVAGGSVAISIIWSGAMLEHFWWGAIFLGMAFVAAAALAVGFFLLPTSRHSEKARLDPVGAALSVIAVTGLLYGLIEAPDNGWTAGQILAAFVVGIVGVASFVVWERSSSNPMLDIAFFSQRRFSFGSLSIVAAYFRAVRHVLRPNSVSPVGTRLLTFHGRRLHVARRACPTRGGKPVQATRCSQWLPSRARRRLGGLRRRASCLGDLRHDFADVGNGDRSQLARCGYRTDHATGHWCHYGLTASTQGRCRLSHQRPHPRVGRRIRHRRAGQPYAVSLSLAPQSRRSPPAGPCLR